MAGRIVVATSSTTFFIGAQRIHVQQGSAWAEESPAVAARPDLFTADPRHALGLDLEAPIEQKTAAPGEKSNVKRRGIETRG